MAIQSKSAYQLKFDVAICHDYLHHNMPLLSFTATRFCPIAFLITRRHPRLWPVIKLFYMAH